MERSLVVSHPTYLAEELARQLRERGMQTVVLGPDALDSVGALPADHCYVLGDAGAEHVVARILARGCALGITRLLVAVSSPTAATRVDELLATTAMDRIEIRRAVPGHVLPPPARRGHAELAPPAGSEWLPALLAALASRGDERPVQLDISQAEPFGIVTAETAAAGLYRLMRSNHRMPLLLAGREPSRAADFVAEAARIFRHVILPRPGAELRIPPLARAGADLMAALGWAVPGSSSLDETLRPWTGPAGVPAQTPA